MLSYPIQCNLYMRCLLLTLLCTRLVFPLFFQLISFHRYTWLSKYFYISASPPSFADMLLIDLSTFSSTAFARVILRLLRWASGELVVCGLINVTRQWALTRANIIWGLRKQTSTRCQAAWDYDIQCCSQGIKSWFVLLLSYWRIFGLEMDNRVQDLETRRDIYIMMWDRKN